MTTRKHVLVTGGAGFIGSHLVERLLAEGRKVVVIDDCSTGDLGNLAAVSTHPDLTVVESRVSDCKTLPELAAGAEAIYHLAAAVGVELVVKSPIYTIENNLHETELLLEAASATGTPTLIASTSEVYGKSQKEAFDESDDLLIGPPHLGRWSYACSKLMDEFLAMAYAQEKHLPVVIVRLFNTVGPRQTGRYGMVLPRFVQAALKNEPLRVHGTGEQTRCFCHVKDTVEAMVRLMAAPAANGEVFNIGGTEEVTIIELARRVIEQLHSESKMEIIPYTEAYAPGFQDMLRRKPIVAKLERTTGFKPSVPLEVIIRQIAEALREQREQ